MTIPLMCTSAHKRFWMVAGACLLVAVVSGPAQTPGKGKPGAPDTLPVIDAPSLRHKVLCGYQGWFRCPGDAADEGWRHWSRNSTRIAPDTLTFEMWPDTSEYDTDEKYAAPGFTHSDGKPAHLFSSAHPKTVDYWLHRQLVPPAHVPLLQPFHPAVSSSSPSSSKEQTP